MSTFKGILIFILFINCYECTVILKKLKINFKTKNYFSRENKTVMEKLKDSRGYRIVVMKMMTCNLKDVSTNDTNQHHEVQETLLHSKNMHNDKINLTRNDLQNPLFPHPLNDLKEHKSRKLLSIDYARVDYLNISDDNTTEFSEFVTIYSNISADDPFINITEINETAIKPVQPACNLGDGQCIKCRDLSPFCHYMFSEEKCMFYNSRHVSILYECGERWFTFDQMEAFYTSAGVILIVTFCAVAYMVRARYHVIIIQDETEFLEDEEYRQMRLAIMAARERMRQRRMLSADSSPSERDSSPSGRRGAVV